MRSKGRDQTTITEFTGPAVVIGCSCTRLCDKPYHTDVSKFFSMNLPRNSADYDCDITKLTGSNLEPFKNRFELTLLEHLPTNVYNSYNPARRGDSLEITEETTLSSGFYNAWEMTSENGFLVIAGCPPEKRCRQSIHMMALKHIELTGYDGRSNYIVIIPKNQNEDLNQIKDRLKQINQEHGLYNAIIPDIDSLSFCERTYESLPPNLPKAAIPDENASEPLPQQPPSVFIQGIDTLNQQIKKIADYATSALAATPKGRLILDLTTELKNMLTNFESLDTESKQNQFNFMQNAILGKIHAHDTIMAEHRAFWKVVVANILIALTGIGALLLGINYLKNQHVFFSKPRSVALIEELDSSVHSLELGTV